MQCCFSGTFPVEVFVDQSGKAKLVSGTGNFEYNAGEVSGVAPVSGSTAGESNRLRCYSKYQMKNETY